MSIANDQLRHYPMRSLLGVQVLATGSYVPDNVVTNEDLQARFGFDPDWIFQRSGIRQRRHAAAEMSTSHMAVEAAKRCLEQAGAKPEEIDLVVVATFTPDMPFPATACVVQHALGIRAPAFDLQAACAGFLYALVTGMQYVASGSSKMALVIGADCNSRVLNPKDQRTYPLFGDGAGAVLLKAGTRQQGLICYTLGSDGGGTDLLKIPMGGSRWPTSCEGVNQALHYMQMDGRAVFKWAIRLLDDTVTSVLDEGGFSADQLDLFVLHQANVRIIDAAASALKLPRDKLVINLDRYGNTAAASVPLALDEAFREGRINRDDKILLSGFGGGLVWGTAILRW